MRTQTRFRPRSENEGRDYGRTALRGQLEWLSASATDAKYALQTLDGTTLFVFVWFSNNSWLAVVVRVAAVLIVFILVIVGVPRRHRGADEAQPRENAF
jgi:hypothetical protein